MKTFIKGSIGLLMLFSSVMISAQTTFNADSASSKVHWKGFKPTGEHNGTVQLKNGFFKVENEKIVAGEFEIDMNSIVVLDIPSDEASNGKLTKHLKSDDFFGVKKFPLAKFIVTSSEVKGDKILIKGNLQIKDKTNPVSFIADVNINAGNLTLKSDTFEIDRSKWDIKFKSQSFFDDLGDKFISDDMELSVDLIAKQ